MKISLDEWDADGEMKLSDLEKLIVQWKKKYGANAIITFDAGYNNVEAEITPSKKVK